ASRFPYTLPLYPRRVSALREGVRGSVYVSGEREGRAGQGRTGRAVRGECALDSSAARAPPPVCFPYTLPVNPPRKHEALACPTAPWACVARRPRPIAHAPRQRRLPETRRRRLFTGIGAPRPPLSRVLRGVGARPADDAGQGGSMLDQM